MTLGDYYFADPRLVLVPIEHLSPAGVTDEFAAAVTQWRGWTAAHIELFNLAFARYWSRTAALARRTRTWAPPRLRHVAVLTDPLAVHPLAQLLNTSAWTLTAGDLDPATSHPELAAYLLVHGDRLATAGDVTMAALLNAAYWFDRTDAERAAFAAAAARSTRPDAAAFQALADATAWLCQLAHEPLRPPRPGGGDRPIPGSGLFVPSALQSQPQALVDGWAAVARGAVQRYEAAWRAPDRPAVAALADWLAAATPPLLIVARGGRIVWDPETPDRLGRLRAELAHASGAAVRDVHADLAVLDRHTRRFLSALAEPDALPPVGPDAEQRGYTYMHRGRRLLAYDLDEPGIDRRRGPALPYARAMLGARAAHEWAHLAVDAGWVPLAVAADEQARRVGELAARLETLIAAAPESIRRLTAGDLASLAADAGTPAGAALAGGLVRRLPDYQANRLAVRWLDEAERETYVRQNVRTLRAEFPPAGLWRMLVRYLYELQYLRFSAVADPRTFFLRSTWFDADVLDRGVLDTADFDALSAAVAAICDAYAVDETRFVARPA